LARRTRRWRIVDRRSSSVAGHVDEIQLPRATVAGVSAPNFAVNNLPTLFTSNGITQVQVQTSSATEFEDVSGVSGLATGNIVSLRGLLFKTAGDPILAAKKVRDRSAVSH